MSSEVENKQKLTCLGHAYECTKKSYDIYQEKGFFAGASWKFAYEARFYFLVSLINDSVALIFVVIGKTLGLVYFAVFWSNKALLWVDKMQGENKVLDNFAHSFIGVVCPHISYMAKDKNIGAGVLEYICSPIDGFGAFVNWMAADLDCDAVEGKETPEKDAKSAKTEDKEHKSDAQTQTIMIDAGIQTDVATA